MVAPRIAALEAAIKVKSLPVIPNNTSLVWLMLVYLFNCDFIMLGGIHFGIFARVVMDSNVGCRC